MANFYKSEVVTAMREQALVPVFYHASKDTALEVIGACARARSQLVEFTNRGEGAADLFGELIKVCRKDFPKLMVGVGSIRDEVTAGIFIGKGADFVVGPTFNPRAAEVCNRLGVPYCPGCGSATEISDAEAAGCEIVKVFPAGEVGGPAFFKSIHGPMARTQMMPTGGVETSAQSLYDWLVKGRAAALGIGSELLRKDLIEKKDWATITLNVRWTLHIIQVLRNKILASEGVLFRGINHVGATTADIKKSLKQLMDITGAINTDPSPTGAQFIRFERGARMEVGLEGGLKPQIALEVTDIKKAIEVLAKNGIGLDGEVDTNRSKTVAYVFLEEKAFGLNTRCHLFCLYSEEVEKLGEKRA